jgi:predicted PurR-regulated permease PerM
MTQAPAPTIVAVRSLAAAPRVGEPAEADGPSRRDWARPLWIIAICCLVAGLRLAREALIPLGLALLVAFVLSGAVEGLRRLHVPRALSAALLLVLLAAAVGGTLDLIAAPAQQWMQSAPKVLRTIERRARPAQSILRRVEEIAQRAELLATAGTTSSSAEQASTSASPSGLRPLDIFMATGWAAVGVVTVMAFAFLMLAAGPSALARMTCALGWNGRATQALHVINAIRRDVGRYYGTLLLINLGYGTVMASAMWLLGMPNPALWGVVAGVLNFVPYLGPVITLAIVSLVALVTFTSAAHVALVAACFLALATVEGHIVEPVFLGRRLDLSPIMVLFALWSGLWLWGVAGMVLALPVLVASKVAVRLARTPAG